MGAALSFAGCWQQSLTRMLALASAHKLLRKAPAAVTSVPGGDVGRWWCLLSLVPLCELEMWALQILARAVKHCAAQLAELHLKHRIGEFRKWVTAQAGSGAG
eukprot:4455586-Pyramimonas_sp.AAC.1